MKKEKLQIQWLDFKKIVKSNINNARHIFDSEDGDLFRISYYYNGNLPEYMVRFEKGRIYVTECYGTYGSKIVKYEVSDFTDILHSILTHTHKH